jgi:hypothetical protein
LLEATSLEKTVCLGLTADDEFIEELVKANNKAVDDHLSRRGHVTIPYGHYRKDLPSIFLTIEEIAGTDLNSFLERVDAILQS